MAYREGEGLAAVVARVELLASILQGTAVVDGDLVALLGLPLALDGVRYDDVHLVLSEDGADDSSQSGHGDGEEAHDG